MVFDIATETIKQGGPGAAPITGILRVDHPDITDFIMCKDDQNHLNNFNISVGITEAFMEAVEKGSDYALINPRNGEPAGTLNADKVFSRIVKQAWQNGEPGIIFLDRLNKDNPTPSIGEIESTNPCGEQPPPSLRVMQPGLDQPGQNGERWGDRLGPAPGSGEAFGPLPRQRHRGEQLSSPQISEMTRANRKIGLGVMGWADMLILLGHRPTTAPRRLLSARR